MKDKVLKLLKAAILVLIASASFLMRLYSVIRFESIIHEFDPWFNFRATKYLSAHGFYKFLNWFDDRTWYPLGRVTGGTLYPGLMVTSHVIHQLLEKLGVPLDIRNVCVLFAPAFSGLTAYFTYKLTCELKDQTAGLLAALFVGLAPGYISRSVAGSYDNEAIAITLLMATFFFWTKAVKLGSVTWAAATAASYFYMVSAWGGYVFLTNIIPLHILALVIMGRYHPRLYVAYSTWYALGTLASMQIPFVGFLPIRSSEHMGAFGVFGLMQLLAAADYVKSLVTPRQFRIVVISCCAGIITLGIVGVVGLTFAGVIAPWSGRFYSLFDTDYARINIPIIASVSEHQPTAWPSFFWDNSVLIWLFPVGVWLAIQELRDEHVFIIVYSVLGSYFAGVMVRLMLTLTPIMCVAGAIAVSSIWDLYNTWDLGQAKPTVPKPVAVASGSFASEPQTAATAASTTTASATSAAGSELRHAVAETSSSVPKSSGKATKKSLRSVPKKSSSAAEVVAAAKSDALLASSNSSASSRNGPVFETGQLFNSLLRIQIKSPVAKLGVMVSFLVYLVMFIYHCDDVTQNAYSSPSVVLSSNMPDGSVYMIDDFREAYYWLRMNTGEDDKIMAWWDYGYQIGGMADRPTLVDNNTWNNTHIATVGKAMSLSEDVAYPILMQHDVKYVLVVFGGLLGYSGDDINKFLWMVRIAQGIWPEEVQERNYFAEGQYRVDGGASDAMKNSLMYKMSYHRFPEMGNGQDRVRGQRLLPRDDPVLDTLEEAYTSKNWLVRLYRVKQPDVLGRELHSLAEYERSH